MKGIILAGRALALIPFVLTAFLLAPVGAWAKVEKTAICHKPGLHNASVAPGRLRAPRCGCDRKRIDHFPINVDKLALCLVGIATDVKRDEEGTMFSTLA